MSLLRLLTTGKSLVSVRDTESRYRLTSQRLLPQFGPTRNPFHSTGRSDLPVAVTSGPAPGDSKAIYEAGVRATAKGLWRKTVRTLNSWKRSPRAMIAGAYKKTAGPTVLPFQKPPVQGELSLDRVKVMRNDLTDADFEVVSGRAKTAPVSLAGRAADRAEQIWGRVSNRLFPAGKP